MILSIRSVKVSAYFWLKLWLKILTLSRTFYQPSLFGTDLLLQLDFNDPLLKLASAIPWHEFVEAFSIHGSKATGVPSKPIRLMVGLLILKQLENLSDEAIVLQCKRNLPTTRLFFAACGSFSTSGLAQHRVDTFSQAHRSGRCRADFPDECWSAWRIGAGRLR